MNTKIALINFYFGSFPNYFPFFLKSCEHNPEITWHIYTDNPSAPDWPSNVVHHGITWENCHALFQQKFDYRISLSSPKKLCDYKPLYGYILQEELKGYDFWGHCDLDVIWGKIMIPDTYFRQYDKLYSLGHFSLYRNNEECQKVLLEYKNGQRVKEVLQAENMIAFDEWGEDNVNDIFQKSLLRFLGEPYGADIWPERWNIYRSTYDPGKNRYYCIEDSMGILKMEHQRLFYHYKNGMIEEVPYVHLQKRRFQSLCDDNLDSYYIIADSFVDGTADIENVMKKSCKKPWIDKNYWMIKKINLLYRIKRLQH